MRALWLGRVEYGAAWDLQKELAALRAADLVPDTLLLLEHPPTITLGRAFRPEHLLVPPDSLEAAGIALHRIDRGGDVTYHGPGQLVGYPIFRLPGPGRDLHAFLRGIEEALILALAEFGLAGRRLPPHTGVWIEDRKIAAIGIKVSRWVVTHGMALNIAPAMEHFGLIVPCGIQDHGVTDLAAELKRPAALEETIPPVVRGFVSVFGVSRLGSNRDAPAGATGGPGMSLDSERLLASALDVAESLC